MRPFCGVTARDTLGKPALVGHSSTCRRTERQGGVETATAVLLDQRSPLSASVFVGGLR
jgi:hypothetical protein